MVKNKTTLAKGIPKEQCRKFEDDKTRNQRDKPLEETLFMATTFNSPKRTLKNLQNFYPPPPRNSNPQRSKQGRKEKKLPVDEY
jgi:hypothetical protein